MRLKCCLCDKRRYPELFRQLGRGKSRSKVCILCEEQEARPPREPLSLAKYVQRLGITEEAYLEILAQQNGRCAICMRTPEEAGGRRLAYDHCHQTGVFRGLLCTLCNTGLGSFQDSLTNLHRAIAYIEGRVLITLPPPAPPKQIVQREGGGILRLGHRTP